MTDPFRMISVCTGNSCRSPAAEGLLKLRLAEKNLSSDVEILSAGISAPNGEPASPESIRSLERLGASLDGFTSQILTEDLCQQSHLILVKEIRHKQFIEEMFPKQCDKVRLLGDFLLPNGPREIPDPIGSTQKYFDQVVDVMDIAIKNMVEQWDELKKRYYPKQTFVIALGADHRGFKGKEILKDKLQQEGYIVQDCGTTTEQRTDHPDFAFMVGERVSLGLADRGVLVCSSGHGMIISANKVPGIRAVMPLCSEHAVMARSHNNANVITFGADYMNGERIEEILIAWLKTDYLGGRYQTRVNKITQYEQSVR